MNHTETTSAAWLRRDGLRGEVDFTMMYVAHDAFSRDLSRLIQISSAGRAHTSQAQAIWAMFSRQLHVHHTAEDTSLWPGLRAAVADADEIAVLDAMEAEHAALDPQLERVEAALHGQDDASLVTQLRDLASGLAAHMQHEEDAALPLVDRRLGAPGGPHSDATSASHRVASAAAPNTCPGSSTRRLSRPSERFSACFRCWRASSTAAYGSRDIGAQPTSPDAPHSTLRATHPARPKPSPGADTAR